MISIGHSNSWRQKEKVDAKGWQEAMCHDLTDTGSGDSTI